jgi:hypothetical protein
MTRPLTDQEAQAEWLRKARAQMARANAAWPEIMAELRAAGLLKPMKRPGILTQHDSRRHAEANLDYVDGFEEQPYDEYASLKRGM